MTSPVPRFVRLKMYVGDEVLKSYYYDASQKHNTKMWTNPFPDAGFDLFTPATLVASALTTQKIDYGVKCSAMIVINNLEQPSGFYIYPRSSTGSKTPLRLANSVGIIDSGYRGNLMSFFDNIRSMDYTVNKMDKLVQICAPGLLPIIVEIVHKEEDLGVPTARGEGGFGSTSEEIPLHMYR
uniref:dUTP diphosphatase n=1 Tax=viral metagenome TaxID=1070528 RepID=A0A6C0B8A8_9ZZZZ